MEKRGPEEPQPILASTRKLVGDTLLISAAGILSRTKGIVFLPIILRAVGFADYGAFIQIFITAKLFASLCSLELGMGFERFLSPIREEDVREKSRHLFSVLIPALSLAALGAVLMLLLAPWLSATFLDHGHVQSLRVAAIVVVSNTLHGAMRGFFWSRRRFAEQSLFSLIYELLPYVGFVLAIAWTRDVGPGILAYAVLDSLAALSMLVWGLRGLTWSQPSMHLFKSYVRYTAPLALSNLEGGLLDRCDRFFISALLGLEAMGLYNVAYRCTELVGYLSIPVRTQMLSYLATAWDRGEVQQSKQMIRTTVLTFLALAIGLLTCLALFSEALLPYLVGDEVAMERLGLMVLMIGIGTLANATRRFLAVFIRLNRTTRDEFLFQFVGLLVNVVANLILIPRFGLLGAAAATLLAYLTVLPLIGWKYGVGFDLSFFGHLGSFLLLALAIVPLRALLPSAGLVPVLASAGFAYLAYLGLVLLFKRRFLLAVRRQLIGWQKQPC